VFGPWLAFCRTAGEEEPIITTPVMLCAIAGKSGIVTKLSPLGLRRICHPDARQAAKFSKLKKRLFTADPLLTLNVVGLLIH
jgi:hypothetical protein